MAKWSLCRVKDDGGGLLKIQKIIGVSSSFAVCHIMYGKRLKAKDVVGNMYFQLRIINSVRGLLRGYI